jgi:hypothetical protein
MGMKKKSPQSLLAPSFRIIKIQVGASVASSLSESISSNTLTMANLWVDFTVAGT